MKNKSWLLISLFCSLFASVYMLFHIDDTNPAFIGFLFAWMILLYLLMGLIGNTKKEFQELLKSD